MRRVLFMIALLSLVADTAAQGASPRPCGSRGSFRNLEVVGLTADQRLICFRERSPQRSRDLGMLTGLMAMETVVGIDFRPADGALYGVTSMSRVVRIDALMASVTSALPLMQQMTAMDGSMTMTPVMLDGMSFGVDFNPARDKLRITSDTGQNLAVSVDTGITTVDTALNPPQMMGGMAAMGVTGVAYTNNDADGATGTVLYDLDTLSNNLVLQAPPAGGTLGLVGSLRVDAGTDVGFDIYSKTKDDDDDDSMMMMSGAPVNAAAAMDTVARVKGLASLNTTDGRTRLYEIDLVTGLAKLRGTFATTNAVTGLAIPILQGRRP